MSVIKRLSVRRPRNSLSAPLLETSSSCEPRQIRLFRIQLSDEGCTWKTVLSLRRPTNIELASFPLDTAPCFHVVSASLKDSEGSSQVRANGAKRRVRNSLAEVLEALENAAHESPSPRGGYLGSWLWMDYVCMSEPPLAEELALIPDLLRKSEGTIIWLAPGHSYTPYHFAIDARERNRKLGTEDDILWKPGGAMRPTAEMHLVEDDLLEGLCELLSQPWFADSRSGDAVRMSQTPPRLLYGSVFLNWDKVLTVADALDLYYEPRTEPTSPKSPPGSPVAVWPNTLQSMRLWIDKIHERHPEATRGLKELAFVTRRARLGEAGLARRASSRRGRARPARRPAGRPRVSLTTVPAEEEREAVPAPVAATPEGPVAAAPEGPVAPEVVATPMMDARDDSRHVSGPGT
jgi:hypothetical protein